MGTVIAPDSAGYTAAHLDPLLMVLSGTHEVHLLTYGSVTDKLAELLKSFLNHQTCSS